jgi:hypothetical protein
MSALLVLRSPPMSAAGLGRVKTVSEGRRFWKSARVSQAARSDQRLDPGDVYDLCHVIGQDREQQRATQITSEDETGVRAGLKPLNAVNRRCEGDVWPLWVNCRR